MKQLIDPELENYCVAKSAPQSAACKQIEDFTRKNVPFSQMLVGPLEGGFLGFLVGLIGAKRVLEIGTYTGYSALAMAERLPEEGELVTLDVDQDTTEIAQNFWLESPDGKKIKSVLGAALETLKNLKGPFDLVFIDADKTNYLNYLKKSLEMLSPNGLVAVDNCLWSGTVLNKNTEDSDEKAIQEFNDYVNGREDLESVLLPIRDGIFLIRKRR